MTWRCYLLHLMKQKCVLKTFLGNLILMSQVSLYLLSFLELTWKLHNIFLTPKVVKKVATNLDFLKASGPNCIPFVVLKNCKPELSDIVAELFNMCQKESCFPDCWKVHWLSLCLRMLKSSKQLKTTILLVFFLWSVKSFFLWPFLLISSMFLGLLNQL